MPMEDETRHNLISIKKKYHLLLIFHYRHVLVIAESVVSGHRLVRIRERLADKLEFIFFDPYGK